MILRVIRRGSGNNDISRNRRDVRFSCSDITKLGGPQATVFDQSCDELRFLNLTSFNTRQHGQMINFKYMGGTHAGVGGSKFGFTSNEPGQTQYHFGKFGDSMCYGINEQQAKCNRPKP